MDNLNDIFVKIHAYAGMIVFVVGILQIIMKKGGKLHRILGQIYFWSWVPLIITGAIIGSLLITFFGLLGFYMVYTGYRFGRQKSMEIKLFDKIFLSVFTLAALYLFAFSIYLMIYWRSDFAYIALFFGIIFSVTVVQDFREYILKHKNRKLSGHKMQWYFEHFTRMYVSFIAATTAFTALQEVFPIVILNWTLPTVIGTVLIVLSSKKYQKKFGIK